MEIKDLKGIFVDADKFDYPSSDDEDDESLDNLGIPSENRFIIAIDKNTSNKALCKKYNSETLFKGRGDSPVNKSDQPWYMQLQVLRESILLKKLSHPAIIKFEGLNLYNNKISFGSDSDDSDDENEEAIPSLFLEYAQNKSLCEHISKKSKLNLNPVKRQICIIGLTAAVRFLHHNNVVHRSLNPNSIWLDSNLYPKIFDFSHSREFLVNEIAIDVTKTDSGKSLYLAPEIFNDEIVFDYLNTLDIFALGRLIYLFVVGVEPFKHPKDPNHKSAEFILKNNITENHSIPYFPDDVPKQYQKLLKSCWSSAPIERPTADQIYDLIVDDDSEDEQFLISKFSMSELQEISNYKLLIKSFEQQNKDELKIFQTALDLHIDQTEQTTKDMLVKLDGFIKYNSVKKHEDEFFQIIKELAKTGDLYERGYLPKVMEYINLFLDENKFEALEFIDIAFGKSNLPSNTKEIKIPTVPKEVTTLNIPRTVKKIWGLACAGYENLQRVYIPESVEIIEDGAFSGCKNLTYVYLPNSIKGKNLGKGAFKDCVSLNSIRLPENLTTIQEMTFQNNRSLTDITLNQNLQTISDNAFTSCDSLETIAIPDSVKYIGKCAFKPCKNLETIKFSKATNYQIKMIKIGRKYKGK